MGNIIFNEKVLITEDDPDVASLLKDIVEGEGFATVTASDGAEGLVELNRNKIFLILSDYSMPHMNGLEFFKSVRQLHPSLPFIMISGSCSRESATSALKEGLSEFMSKPVDWNELIKSIHKYSRPRLDVKDDSPLMKKTAGF